jgi:hypothetical protein
LDRETKVRPLSRLAACNHQAKPAWDTRTGVDDNDYQVPFRFTGKLDKLTIKLGAADETLLQETKNKAQ